MCRDYYLHKRRNGFYYVEYIDKVTGLKLSAKSTGETEKIKAQVIAEIWLIHGIPTGRMKKVRPIAEIAGIESVIKAIRKAELNSDDALKIVKTLKSMELIDIAAVKNTGAGTVIFIDYLKEFWDYDKSPYIKNRLSLGKRIGRNHAHQCMLKVNSILTEFFKYKKLNCVTTDDLRKLSDMSYDRGLSTSTTNQIMLSVVTPIKWAYKRKMIASNPCEELDKFTIEKKERGILTEAEASEVLRPEHWKDKRAFIASLVSFTTSARMGEILALRSSSIINNDLLKISNSYSRIDGLKCPKNTKKRPVYLYSDVKQYLIYLLKMNPHKNYVDDPFLFYSLQPDKPCDNKILLNGLREVLDKLNIDWKKRNITFHSWRHWYITYANREIDREKVMKVSGHLTESTHCDYIHKDENDVRKVGKTMEKVFDNILQFKTDRIISTIL